MAAGFLVVPGQCLQVICLWSEGAGLNQAAQGTGSLGQCMGAALAVYTLAGCPWVTA